MNKILIKNNPYYSYIGDIVLQLNGKLDLPVDTSAIGIRSEESYFGSECENTRLAQTIENLKIWKRIYENQIKFDIVFVDNSDDKFFGEHYTELSEALSFTNSWIFHNNKNHYFTAIRAGGEKSGLLLPIKFGVGAWAANQGYKNLIHFESKYTPKENYPWLETVDQFNKQDLEVLITPSRYNKCGFNHNIMIVNPKIWSQLSQTWQYNQNEMNADLMDLYEAFRKLGMVGTSNWNQPYEYINKNKMKLWTDCPSQWYHSTKTFKYVETDKGYEGIKI